MITRVFKAGDAAAVTIPGAILKDMGIKVGDRVTVNFFSEMKSITIEPVKKEKKYPIHQEFHGVVKEFIDRYQSALVELSKGRKTS